jgi:hypothetical protein
MHASAYFISPFVRRPLILGAVHLLVDEGTLPKRDIVRTKRSGD